jgi:two-component system, LuxR family, response regulator FixJ
MSADLQPVCVLDDDLSVRRSLQRLLESDGIAARTFEYSNDFLAYASAHAVVVAVLDVVMPGTSGIEVQEQLREISPATRVIMMTGRDEPSVRSSAMDRGAVGFLVKPFDDEAFLALVRGSLGCAA